MNRVIWTLYLEDVKGKRQAVFYFASSLKEMSEEINTKSPLILVEKYLCTRRVEKRFIRTPAGRVRAQPM